MLTDPEDPHKKVSTTILKTNCGHIKGGNFVAFMGPSGSGKTTLLDIIAKKKTTPHEGDVYVNGQKVDRFYRRITSYVGQEEPMHPHLTVREVVKFYAMLKHPRFAKMTTEEQQSTLDTLLDHVGLLHVQSSRIGGEHVRGISGGQRRRVALARGMASGAKIMFCDEPTSGLSATDAELCIKVLQNLVVKWAVTVIVVIHQPRVEVARLFDQLILLTAHPGRIVYDGLMKDAEAYWADVGYPVPAGSNFADYFLDVVTPGAPGAVPDLFAQWYEENLYLDILREVEQSLADKEQCSPLEVLIQESKRNSEPSKFKHSIYPTSYLIQFKCVFQREVHLVKKDFRIIWGTIVMQIIKGLLLGVMFLDVGNSKPEGIAQMSFLFILIMTVSFGTIEQVPRLLEGRHIMKLEVDEALYNEWVFIVASATVSSTMAFTGACFFLIIMFLFSGLAWAYITAFLIWGNLLFITFLAYTAMVAAVAKNQPAAQAIAMPGMLIIIMFSGFYISKQSAPSFLRWLLYVSPMSWCMELMMKQIYQDNPVVWPLLVTTFGYEDLPEWIGVCICLGLTILFRALQFCGLRYLNKIQR